MTILAIVAIASKRSELQVGVFLFIGLVLLGGLIVQFGRFDELFGRHYRITVIFDDASGLIKGSEVRMGGARIGQVAELPHLNDAVQSEVTLTIFDHIRIPVDSSFQIASATLLGDKLITILPPENKNGEFLVPGSHIQGGGPTGLEALQSSAELVSRDVRRLIQNTEVTLGKINVAVDDIHTASQQLNTGLGKINQSLLADSNLTHISQTLANLDQLSTQWQDASTRLNPTLDEARAAVAAVKSAATQAEKSIAAAKPAIARLPAAVDQLALATTKANKTLDRMNRGEGMLGAFVIDNDVALDFKAFMHNLRTNGILLYREAKEQKRKR